MDRLCEWTDLSKHVFVIYGVDECERAMLKHTLKHNECCRSSRICSAV
jgi:hypothetical protein